MKGIVLEPDVCGRQQGRRAKEATLSTFPEPWKVSFISWRRADFCPLACSVFPLKVAPPPRLSFVPMGLKAHSSSEARAHGSAHDQHIPEESPPYYMFEQQLLRGKLNSLQNYINWTFSSSTPKFWDQFKGCIHFQGMQLRTVLRCLWSRRSNLAIFKSLRKVGEPLSQTSHFIYFQELNLYLQTCNHPQTHSPRRPSASLLY